VSRTYVVTGANRGIGLEFARQLSARGDRLIATARRPEGARQLRELSVRVEPLDLADAASVDAFAAKLAGEPVDVLIHNAAVGTAGPAVEGLRMQDLERSYLVNAIGPLRLTQALLPNLRARSTRQVIALSSGLGSVSGNDSGGWYAYRASKAALNQFVRTLAQELAPEGFTCIALDPGWVRTDMGGPDAPLTPAESVKGMLEVLDRLRASDTSKFFDRRGRQVPW
jgi:NAD(P)-dependent dehydrogenase (short-subunit alcohol dehydrogenase family)